jgi:hypothetical protein
MSVEFAVDRTITINRKQTNWAWIRIQHGFSINGEARSVQKRKRLSGVNNYLQIINFPKGLIHNLAQNIIFLLKLLFMVCNEYLDCDLCTKFVFDLSLVLI